MLNGQLFSLHFDSLWQTANQNWCDALLRRDRVIAAIRYSWTWLTKLREQTVWNGLLVSALTFDDTIVDNHFTIS
jgi:hypothetical protein